MLPTGVDGRRTFSSRSPILERRTDSNLNLRDRGRSREGRWQENVLSPVADSRAEDGQPFKFVVKKY